MACANCRPKATRTRQSIKVRCLLMNRAAINLPNVAIVGRPNVGKSALFNRLIGRRVAIVHDQSGITRDRISAVCTRGTQPFVVWDTGGIAGAGESELTAQVRLAVQEAIRQSDILLFLVDGKDGLSPIDQELARMLRRSHKPVVLVINNIDTAGIRRRGKQSSSVEVFSVMRAERSIRRADLCILIGDLTMGVTAQDKRIAGLIQKARKAAIVVLNKWDLIKPKRREKQTIAQLVDETRARIFFLDYAPVLIASALTGENIEKLFAFIEDVRRAAQQRIGTGVLNRLLRAAVAANPPPMISGRRLKLFYAAQTRSGGFQAAEGALEKGRLLAKQRRDLTPPEFVLFVNEPRLLPETYRRYLEARIREAQPYTGLPIILTLRPRSESVTRASRLRTK